ADGACRVDGEVAAHVGTATVQALALQEGGGDQGPARENGGRGPNREPVPVAGVAFDAVDAQVVVDQDPTGAHARVEQGAPLQGVGDVGHVRAALGARRAAEVADAGPV